VYKHSVDLDLPLAISNKALTTAVLRVDYQGCADGGICYPPNSNSYSLKSLNSLLSAPAGEQEFLPVDKAFPVSADLGSGNTVKVILGVSPGYYLYRDKIHFKLLTGDGSSASGIALGKYKLPQGTIKKDPAFGDTEVYKHSVDLDLPLAISNKALTTAVLRVDYQGCADGGICYPPNSNSYSLKIR